MSLFRTSLRALAALALCATAVTGSYAEPAQGSSTSDHSKHEALKGPFADGPAVTRACLGCHTEAARQVHKTIHWTWEYAHQKTGQRLGKRSVVNSYCGSVTTNYPRCTSCHAGYGWKDADFDFTAEDKVDCLVCHDTTGSYAKFPSGAGHPAYTDTLFQGKKLFKAVDLVKVAQAVGKTSRNTCGACHFSGGGGDGVKHGDMDSSLASPDKHLDVHMGKDGLGYTCATCHTFIEHEVTGSRYAVTAKDTTGVAVPGRKETRATCESCHGSAPHAANETKLNDHAERVACQTCHIPAYARGGVPTKTWWDWETAGRLGPDGKPMIKKDERGWVVYDTQKGDFTWGEQLAPEYFWFDGTVRYSLLGDRFDPTKGPVEINALEGSADNPGARIWPFKVMRGKQPYDTVNNTLLIGHLFGKDDAAYWKSFDWDKSIRAGMKEAKEIGQTDLEYSGKLAFIETRMYWPITHMVAPAEEALGCGECHSQEGRLAGITGVYLPGRDTNPWIERIGWLLAAATLVSVLLHGLMRIRTSRRNVKG